MKAFVFTEFGGPQTQALVELPRPEPGPGQLLVAVRAAGVNPVDWKARAGWLREYIPFELPTIMGSEVAGVVEQVGDGVESFEIGDEVFGIPATGAFADYTLVPAATAARKPPSMPFAVAATLPVAVATAYDGVQQLGLADGMTLLVIGAGGGVGVAALQIARARGVNVIGVASPQKRDLIESLGATHVAYGDQAVDRVRAATPDGVDAILDLVGGPAFEAFAAVARPGGKLVSAVDPMTAGRFGGGPIERHIDEERFSAVAAFVVDNAIDPHITASYPLEQAAEAVARVESGHSTGKVVIEIR